MTHHLLTLGSDPYGKSSCNCTKLLHTIDYVPYPVHCIPVSYLFYNWKFIPFTPLILPISPTPLQKNFT